MIGAQARLREAALITKDRSIREHAAAFLAGAVRLRRYRGPL